MLFLEYVFFSFKLSSGSRYVTLLFLAHRLQSTVT